MPITILPLCLAVLAGFSVRGNPVAESSPPRSLYLTGAAVEWRGRTLVPVFDGTSTQAMVVQRGRRLALLARDEGGWSVRTAPDPRGALPWLVSELGVDPAVLAQVLPEIELVPAPADAACAPSAGARPVGPRLESILDRLAEGFARDDRLEEGDTAGIELALGLGGGGPCSPTVVYGGITASCTGDWALVGTDVGSAGGVCYPLNHYQAFVMHSNQRDGQKLYADCTKCGFEQTRTRTCTVFVSELDRTVPLSDCSSIPGTYLAPAKPLNASGPCEHSNQFCPQWGPWTPSPDAQCP